MGSFCWVLDPYWALNHRSGSGYLPCPVSQFAPSGFSSGQLLTTIFLTNKAPSSQVGPIKPLLHKQVPSSQVAPLRQVVLWQGSQLTQTASSRVRNTKLSFCRIFFSVTAFYKFRPKEDSKGKYILPLPHLVLSNGFKPYLVSKNYSMISLMVFVPWLFSNWQK